MIKGKRYAFAAAICCTILALYAVYNIIEEVSYYHDIIEEVSYDYAQYYIRYIVLRTVFAVVMFGFAVTLFTKKIKMFIFAAGAYTLYYCYYCILNFCHYYNDYDDLFCFIAGGALVLVLAFALKKNNVVKKLWFIPGSVMIVDCIISICQFYGWLSILFNVIEAAALVFIGLWLKENAPNVSSDRVTGGAKRYTRLFDLPKNLYAEGSPVIILAGALSQDNLNGSIFVQIKMQNISDKIVKAVTVSIEPYDTAGRKLGNAKTFQYLDLTVRNNGVFGEQIPIILNPAVRSFTVKVVEVVYIDNTIWSGTDDLWTALNFYQSLDNLKDKEIAKQYRIDMGGGDFAPMSAKDLWQCVCGKISSNNNKFCTGCGRGFDEITAAYSLEKLVPEKEERLKREAEKKAEETKITAIFLSAVAESVIIILMISNIIIPTIKYNKAVKLLNEKNYAEAYDGFEELEDFKDSPEQMEECWYRKASELLETNQYVKAIDELDKISSEYKDSADLKAGAIDAMYNNYVNLIEDNKLSEAESYYNAVYDYIAEYYKEFGIYHKYALLKAFCTGNKTVDWDEIEEIADLADAVESSNMTDFKDISKYVDKVNKIPGVNRKKYKKTWGHYTLEFDDNYIDFVYDSYYSYSSWYSDRSKTIDYVDISWSLKDGVLQSVNTSQSYSDYNSTYKITPSGDNLIVEITHLAGDDYDVEYVKGIAGTYTPY